MGTLLKVNNADFSANGIPLCPPAPITEEDLIPLFQNNATPVGTIVLISTSSTTGYETSPTGSNNAFGVTRTAVESNFTFIRFKPKNGYSITFRGYNLGSSYPTQIFSAGGSKTSFGVGGTPTANTEEVIVGLDGFSEFAFNVRSLNDSDVLQSTDLHDYFDYIKADGVFTNPLDKIKAVMESKFFYNDRWGVAFIFGDPGIDSSNRCACGAFTASMIGGLSFKVTPKQGCKMVPLQGSGTAGRWSFTWQTTPQVFDNFESYPVIGFQPAYSSDANIPSTASLWDFVDVELVSE